MYIEVICEDCLQGLAGETHAEIFLEIYEHLAAAHRLRADERTQVTFTAVYDNGPRGRIEPEEWTIPRGRLTTIQRNRLAEWDRSIAQVGQVRILDRPIEARRVRRPVQLVPA